MQNAHIKSVVLAIFALSLLAACGNKDDLFLENGEKNRPSSGVLQQAVDFDDSEEKEKSE